MCSSVASNLNPYLNYLWGYYLEQHVTGALSIYATSFSKTLVWTYNFSSIVFYSNSFHRNIKNNRLYPRASWFMLADALGVVVSVVSILQCGSSLNGPRHPL